MYHKLLVIFFFLLLASSSMCAKSTSLTEEVRRIDSFILYNNYSESEVAANELMKLILKKERNKDNTILLVKVLLQQAKICIRKNIFPKATSYTLDAIEQAKKYGLHELTYKAYLIAAEIYETTDHFPLCKQYLQLAHEVYSTYGLESLYSTYCIRRSSYSRFVKELDSAKYYAKKALELVEHHPNARDNADAYLLLGILWAKEDYQTSNGYFGLAAGEFYKYHDWNGVAMMYNNITNSYLKHRRFIEAKIYSDSAMKYEYAFPAEFASLNYYTYQMRSGLYDSLINADSALFYYKKFHLSYVEAMKQMEQKEIKKITLLYENNKKEAVIKSKNQQLVFVLISLVLITVITILLIRNNRAIKKKNKTINSQLTDLSKALEQKQVLLSELQHRVKNNLQHVISILEIQKESTDFNNIEELIRGNQNRIHSMALLHKKLNVSDNVSDVDLKKYIQELAELVKDSYTNQTKQIEIEIDCDVALLSIEKVLPLGLIIVELVSNSMKYAFKEQTSGLIQINFSQQFNLCGESKYFFYYSDDGIGFNFVPISSKGLGIEIIKGLIDQLNGKYEIGSDGGFKLSISFN